MVRHRLSGTKIELKQRIKRIERDKSISIRSISDYLPVKGSNKYYRVFIDEEQEKDEETE